MPGRLERVARSAFEGVSPYWRANLGWLRAKRRGDPERDLVDSIVRPGMVVADVGASAGDFTARMARLVGRRGTVHAFEPHPIHRARLASMAAHRPRIVVHPVALSDRSGTAELHVPVIRTRPRYGLATLRPVEGGERVPIRTERFDEVFGEAERLDFVKCDVEGHEQAVLAGAEASLRRLRPVLLIEIEQRHLPEGAIEETFGLLRGWGYEGRALFAEGLRPLQDFDVDRDQLAFVEPGQDSMPRGYVNTFLLTPSR
jgi:FkbM family methyltransferase